MSVCVASDVAAWRREIRGATQSIPYAPVRRGDWPARRLSFSDKMWPGFAHTHSATHCARTYPTKPDTQPYTQQHKNKKKKKNAKTPHTPPPHTHTHTHTPT